MVDPENKPPKAETNATSDEESTRSALEADDVPQLDSQNEAAPRELVERPKQGQQDEGSEMSSMAGGSVDAAPRRVDSPIDSVLSGPDETPSVQVGSSPDSMCIADVSGLLHVFTRQ